MDSLELVEEFKKYQSAILNELQSDEELWELSTRVSVNDAGKILPLRVHPETEFLDLPKYWENLVQEFGEFICKTTSKYDDLYKKIESADKTLNTWFIPVIAGAIATKIGIEALIITPFVRLLVASVSRIGIEAFCRNSSAGELLDKDGQQVKLPEN